MANSRIVFKFGDYNFPLEYIQWNTFKVKPNQRQDLDSYTDASGLTQRNALEHTKTDIQFSTIKLSEDKYRSIMNGIVRNYRNPRERDANCEYYDQEYGANKTGHFYLNPSLEVPIVGIDSDGKFIYDAVTFHFIEY